MVQAGPAVLQQLSGAVACLPMHGRLQVGAGWHRQLGRQQSCCECSCLMITVAL